MAKMLKSVDSRTKLAGHNRLELLLFKLSGSQMYGINVFKVKEVIHCPELVNIPHSHPVVKGVSHLRNQTIPIIDLGMAIDKQGVELTEDSFVIITEYNRYIQGFLVSSVDRIVNMNWEEILPPPRGSGGGSFLTAVTRVDETLVEIIDVERVFANVIKSPQDVSEDIVESAGLQDSGRPMRVLVVDDSSVARNQIRRVLEKLGIEVVLGTDGLEGLEILQKWVAEGIDVSEHIALLISDVEMPRMDGYTLTTKIRQIPELQNLFVILHTSLSGVFNQDMVKKVGADLFIPKFKPDELAEQIIHRIKGEELDQIATG